MLRASSGSSSSITSIEPLMSANSAVTILRSPSSVSGTGASAIRIGAPPDFFAETGVGASEAPQSSQNFAEGEFSAPHFRQRLDSGLPHSAQKFLPEVLSMPHLEQRILVARLLERRLGFSQVGGIE